MNHDASSPVSVTSSHSEPHYSPNDHLPHVANERRNSLISLIVFKRDCVVVPLFRTFTYLCFNFLNLMKIWGEGNNSCGKS